MNCETSGDVSSRYAVTDVGDQIMIAIHPGRVQFAKPGVAVPGRNALLGTDVGQRFIGNIVYLFVQLDSKLAFMVQRHPAESSTACGDTVQVTWAPEEASVLPGVE